MANMDIAANHYAKAVKMGQKAARSAQQQGKSPYLPALEESNPEINQLARVSLGIVSVPTDLIIGSLNAGRTPAFSCSFMPMLEDNTEFATKWKLLYVSVEEEGMRDPVKMVEYMGKFYAIEGNKRISVMKYLDAAQIDADLVRIIPKRVDTEECRIYFESLDFYADCGVLGLTFSEEGRYEKLTRLLGQTPGVKWSEDAVLDLRAAYFRFVDALKHIPEQLDKLTPADVFLLYVEAFGYTSESTGSDKMRANLNRLVDEIRAQDKAEPISLKLDEDGQRPGLVQQLLRGGSGPLNVCFINTRSPEVSGWTYWHALGKNHVDSVFEGKLTSRIINNVDPKDCQATIEQAVKEGANVVFTTSPVLLSGAIKAAMQLPNAKILNCSLVPQYHSVRSYYLRMYQAKFVMGAIAGAVSDNNRIGYIADYPVFGVAASINAFALGARLVNPRARIYLEWSTVKDNNPEEILAANDVHVICNRDIAAPSAESTAFGLYMIQPGMQPQNLAMPVWNWGRLYEDLLRRIQNGVWNNDATSRNAQALNYWWGMDVGAIDVYYTKKLDPGTRRLTDMLRKGITDHTIHAFTDEIYSQDGTLRCKQGEKLTPAQIIAMDWLCDNVIGSFPTIDQLRPEAFAFVELQGLRNAKHPDINEIRWDDTEKTNQ